MHGYDYNLGGSYFITICTKSKINYFGDIKNNKMVLSKIGKIAQGCLQEIESHFNDVELGEFVVIPDHVHFVVHLMGDGVGTGDDVGTRHALSLPALSLPKRKYMRLSNIIGSFKSSTTRIIRQNLNNHQFAWQRSYYDRIIRSQKELENIEQYIFYNPANWVTDNNLNVI